MVIYHYGLWVIYRTSFQRNTWRPQLVFMVDIDSDFHSFYKKRKLPEDNPIIKHYYKVVPHS